MTPIEDTLIELSERAPTKGPWSIVGRDIRGPNDVALDDRMIAEMYGNIQNPEVFADAALIAACSPEVIKALAEVVKAARREHGQGSVACPITAALRALDALSLESQKEEV